MFNEHCSHLKILNEVLLIHRIPRLVLKMITTELGLLKLNNLERTTTMKPILTGNIQALDMIY